MIRNEVASHASTPSPVNVKKTNHQRSTSQFKAAE